MAYKVFLKPATFYRTSVPLAWYFMFPHFFSGSACTGHYAPGSTACPSRCKSRRRAGNDVSADPVSQFECLARIAVVTEESPASPLGPTGPCIERHIGDVRQDIPLWSTLISGRYGHINSCGVSLTHQQVSRRGIEPSIAVFLFVLFCFRFLCLNLLFRLIFRFSGSFLFSSIHWKTKL